MLTGGQQDREVQRHAVAAPAHQAAAPVPVAPPSLERAFPGKALHQCGVSGLADGRYAVGSATLVVRAGTGTVTESITRTPVRQLGTTLGMVSAAEGRCVYEPNRMLVIEGTVDGGGVHVVAGCPAGTLVETEADGSFSLQVPEGSLCAPRVVREDEDGGLAIGPVMTVDPSATAGVELSAELTELDEGHVEQAVALMKQAVASQVEMAQQELARLESLDAPSADEQWLIETQREQVAFFEEQQARLDDPTQHLELVAELLFSSNN